MITFSCSNCRQSLQIGNEFAGQDAQCPFCQVIVTVPTLKQAVGAHRRPVPAFCMGAICTITLFSILAFLLVGHTRPRTQSQPSSKLPDADSTPTGNIGSQSPKATVDSKPEVERAASAVEAKAGPTPELQQPAEMPRGSDDATQESVVEGDFTTAILGSVPKGSPNRGKVLVFPKSKLWSEMRDNGQEPVALEGVYLLKPGSVFFVADGGVDGNVLSDQAKGVAGGGRADLIIKYITFGLNGTKSGLGTAMFENGIFLETTGQPAQHPQLRAGEFYKVGAQGLIEPAKRGEYSVQVSFGDDQEIRSAPSISSEAIYPLQHGEKVELLMSGETPIAWHKVSFGLGTAEGWVRAQWDSLTFLARNTLQTIQREPAVDTSSQTSDSPQETAAESRLRFERRYGLRHGTSAPASASQVAGPSLEMRTSREGSFNSPPKNWPKANAGLSGFLKVTIRNPNNFQVRVGLRSGGRGSDFVVPANAARFVTVPNGRYDIYFQYSSDPEGLYQGDSFTLNNSEAEIQIVKVVNGNYGIRKIN